MAVLVTGGEGFIGSALVKKLLDRGEKVVIFDIQTGESFMKGKKTISIKGDITNWHEVLNVVQEYKIKNIFHLAAMLSSPSEDNPWASINLNAIGTFHVLEADRLFQVKKVIFTSSMAVYNGLSPDTIVTDDTMQRPPIIYGVAKVFSELLGLYYHKKFGIDFRG